ncbi:MAG: hypothetical protein COW62_06595 [Zetaproteobacteria bacterium CG17_big_fil_post_rev_8_21_14_2_50_50_13]|nr:MAG: hypothetical protein AUJ56_00930 [Zetaproteobacteria bacterium CG1_02_49_23]PIQ32937.1 MAG: hypothetical protein COW62_06595 [Zetaproteobacteria bacterium CG17_big_fil_post_rev_8_21_14_2_50_50_13]PIY56554.1 MAG: hypothetical protein COZ00_03655 [Zetaproteobacteria bacterium CG_4_10_14_0_8_um_filter_49_80]
MNSTRKQKLSVVLLFGSGVIACAIGIAIDQLLAGVLFTQLFWGMAFSLLSRINDDVLPSYWHPLAEEKNDFI